MAATVLQHSGVSSEPTLVEPFMQLSVDEAPIKPTEATPRTLDVGDAVDHEASVAPTDLAPQTVDVGSFELDDNVLKGPSSLFLIYTVSHSIVDGYQLYPYPAQR